ncbi:PH domain-containing protein [Streptomyces sp. NPDC006514]|uniref:PH domain-containing protein n=1 Tax=Streptomyces sp. NPDC006514 TaxID=3154308 RepID=UPI0033AD6F43
MLKVWLEAPPLSLRVSVPITVLFTAVLGWGLYVRSRQMTTVDEEGISVRGGRGPRRLTWDGIHDIRSEALPAKRSWGPSTVTYAYRTYGRRVLLLCVDDEELPALEPELAFLRALLLRRRSADRAPDPRAEPRIPRQNGRRTASDRWLGVVLTVAVLAGILLAAGLGGPA